MSINFNCEKLMLSPESFELLDRPDRIGIAVVKTLRSIDLKLGAIDLAPLIQDACSIQYLATLPARIYQDLLAWELVCPDFSRSQIVDGLVKASANSLLPAIRTEILIAGKSEGACSLESAQLNPYRWQDPDPDSQRTYQVPFGILVKRNRGKNAYWYWQYYRWDGTRADIYMHKTLNGAIARVRSIGIPQDAKPQRLNKSKKVHLCG